MQKFTASGDVRDAVGLLRRRPRPVRADRRTGDRRRGRTSTWSTPATTASRSSTPNGDFITDWGRKRHRARRVRLRLLAELHASPPAAGSRSPATTSTWRTPATTASSASTSKAAKRWRGARYGSGPGQFSYPRGVAANESEVIVSDDDNHRIEKFSPEGAFEAAGRHAGRRARASSASPTASPWTRPATCTWPTTATTASSSSTRSCSSRELGAASAPNRASWRSRARWRATRRATRTWPTPPTTAIEVFDPERRLPAHDRHLRARPGAADRAARPGDRPDRPAARVRHRRQPHRGSSRPAAMPTPGSGRSPAGTPPASTTRRASASTRADRCTSPT